MSRRSAVKYASSSPGAALIWPRLSREKIPSARKIGSAIFFTINRVNRFSRPGYPENNSYRPGDDSIKNCLPGFLSSLKQASLFSAARFQSQFLVAQPGGHASLRGAVQETL